MFDIGWTELLVVAVVMILVVGPKDLPRMLRTFGQTLGKVRRMANDFQSTINDALREAEKQADISDMKAAAEKAANFDPLGDITKAYPQKHAGAAAKAQAASQTTPAASDDAPAAGAPDPAPEPVADPDKTAGQTTAGKGDTA